MSKKSYIEKGVVRKITESTFRLMMEKPLDKISITEICTAAKVSRVSFYRNFDSKNEIIEAVIVTVTDLFLEKFSDKLTNKEITTYLFEDLERNKDLLRVLYEARLFLLFFDSFVRIYSHHGNNLEKATFLSGGVLSICMLWAKHDFMQPPSELLDKLVF